ncbi:MAG: phosphoenolpyruvate--protein phosphotransferase [Candidatus Omnitrophica bacterium]|nr:phosphoenolpyruvate--protein phosphotransferase [Candidatus Omnitrophota bacterium]
MEKHYGIAVSPGIVFARALVMESKDLVVKKVPIDETDIPREIARFEDALTKTRAELLNIRKKIASEIGREHSEIFNAHLLILEDRTLIEEVISRLREEKLNVEYIFSDIIEQYSRAFSQIDDSYLKERTSDVKDIGRRIIGNLMGRKKETLAEIKDQVVVVSHDLSPSETALMNKKYVIGFATDVGGPTSHAAIMARSMEIPAVVGLETISSEVLDGDIVVIDGNNGIVIVNPDEETLSEYKTEEEKFEAFVQRLDQVKELAATTLDGHTIELSANIEFPSDIDSVLLHGAHGIGLYRTEYMYLNKTVFPTEEEQFMAYKTVAERMGNMPVVIRTLDLGGDKFTSSLDMPKEINSFMGWRAIRFCLTRTDVFKTQLRAIMRASVFGNLKVMFPMISNLSELLKAKEILAEVKQDLKNEGIEFNDTIPIGAMIEVPSAAIASDIFAKEADFFSIGSNDLIQYSLAVDRVNEKIAYLYQPTHPAIIRLIKYVIEQGHKCNIMVGMCGEMAANPSHAVLLVGMGIDELSISAAFLPKVKKVIRSIKLSDAQKLVEECLKLTTSEEVSGYLDSKLLPILESIEQ